MASQMNPVISAFLQARQQADERGRAMLQQQMMQQKLEQEAAQDEALNEYRLGQLQLNAMEAKQQADIAKQTQDLNQKKFNLDVFGKVSEGFSKGQFQRPAAQAQFENFGINDPETLANFLNSLEEMKAQETQAEVANILALVDPKAQTAGAITGAQETAKEPFKEKENQFKLSLENVRQTALVGRENKRIEAANERARMQINAAAQRSKEQIAARLQVAEKKGAGGLKISAGERKELENFHTAINILDNIEEKSSNEEYGSFFVGPAKSLMREASRKVGIYELPEKQAEMQALLGQATAIIAHPLFGASFTEGEKKIIHSFVASAEGNIYPGEFRGKLKATKELIQQRIKVKADLFGFDFTPDKKSSENKDIDQDKINKKLKQLGLE